MTRNPVQTDINQGSAVTYVAQLCAPDGEPIDRADVSTITCLVEPSGGDAMSISVDVEEALLDKFWTTDNQRFWPYGGRGYNFVHVISGDNFSAAETDYSLQYVIVLSGGTTLRTSRRTLHTDAALGG